MRATAIHAWATLFWLEKEGSAKAEWEDGAACDEGDPFGGRNPRFVVLDGATEAYDSVRWVELLARSFLTDGPQLEDDSRGIAAKGFHPWFRRMQETWAAETEPFSNVIEEHKFRSQGSLATLLGCEFTGMTGESPAWHAVAMGDTLLFQVRGASLVKHFPPLEPEDFGLAPPGVPYSSILAGADGAATGVRLGRTPGRRCRLFCHRRICTVDAVAESVRPIFRVDAS